MLLLVHLDGTGSVRDFLCHGPPDGCSSGVEAHGGGIVVDGLIAAACPVFQHLQSNIHIAHAGCKIRGYAGYACPYRRILRKLSRALPCLVLQPGVQVIFQIPKIFPCSICTGCSVHIVERFDFIIGHVIINEIVAQGIALRRIQQFLPCSIIVVDVLIERIRIGLP